MSFGQRLNYECDPRLKQLLFLREQQRLQQQSDLGNLPEVPKAQTHQRNNQIQKNTVQEEEITVQTLVDDIINDPPQNIKELKENLMQIVDLINDKLENL